MVEEINDKTEGTEKTRLSDVKEIIKEFGELRKELSEVSSGFSEWFKTPWPSISIALLIFGLQPEWITKAIADLKNTIGNILKGSAELSMAGTTKLNQKLQYLVNKFKLSVTDNAELSDLSFTVINGMMRKLDEYTNSIHRYYFIAFSVIYVVTAMFMIYMDFMGKGFFLTIVGTVMIFVPYKIIGSGLKKMGNPDSEDNSKGSALYTTGRMICYQANIIIFMLMAWLLLKNQTPGTFLVMFIITALLLMFAYAVIKKPKDSWRNSARLAAFMACLGIMIGLMSPTGLLNYGWKGYRDWSNTYLGWYYSKNQLTHSKIREEIRLNQIRREMKDRISQQVVSSDSTGLYLFNNGEPCGKAKQMLLKDTEVTVVVNETQSDNIGEAYVKVRLSDRETIGWVSIKDIDLKSQYENLALNQPQKKVEPEPVTPVTIITAVKTVTSLPLIPFPIPEVELDVSGDNDAYMVRLPGDVINGNTTILVQPGETYMITPYGNVNIGPSGSSCDPANRDTGPEGYLASWNNENRTSLGSWPYTNNRVSLQQKKLGAVYARFVTDPSWTLIRVDGTPFTNHTNQPLLLFMGVNDDCKDSHGRIKEGWIHDNSGNYMVRIKLVPQIP